MKTGTTVVESFEVNYRWGQYRAGGNLPFSVTLYSCEEEVPPKYDNYTGTTAWHQKDANLSNAIMHNPSKPKEASAQGVSRAGRAERKVLSGNLSARTRFWTGACV